MSLSLVDNIEVTPSRVVKKFQKVYNLLWISPKISPTGNDKTNPSISEKTIERILSIAEQNPQADVRFWVDYKQITPAQIEQLEQSIVHSNNLELANLCTIRAYNQHTLFSKQDDSLLWQKDKHSLLWRQVDTARLLVALQGGDYEQSFYSDVDVTNLKVDSDEVQIILSKQGIILSGVPYNTSRGYENQLFGFNKNRRGLFNLLYIETLKDVQKRKQNGYSTFVNFFNTSNEVKRLGIDPLKSFFIPNYG